MEEREEQQSNPDPEPIKHTDAERVGGSEAESESAEGEQDSGSSPEEPATS